MNGCEVAPHAFEPLRFWDRWFDSGRCRRCFRPKWVHPVNFYSEARSMLDTSKARLPGPCSLCGVSMGWHDADCTQKEIQR